ncbi:PREDICTED: leucine-rich repeat receptor protein kinase EMS1-like [Tarenaya hassleriana]|uniref:leucine-rich repeat receptor protein kinase EMS1-like n=1 Tax=Tarenaya hassleriana TaxID=28532 RepID=UPI00053C417A|nr:PREDICTED: leucine-rich repeat receptor protein kinase EMS1-like [Tarenaya hassleriana]
MAFPAFLLCFFLFLFLVFSASTSIDEASSETNSLVSFKLSLENPQVLSSWNRKSPASSHCDWIGVTCQFGQVHSLSLPAMSLRGRLYPSLFSLRFLTILDLSENSLSGEIPPGISRLKGLKQLSLGGNRFSGMIPAEIGGLAQLESLQLGPNLLSGPIPPELGRLKRLQNLDLSGNSLTRTFPSGLGELTHLLYLDLSDNYLSGSLPPAIFSNFPALTSLDVSNNSFSGEIPAEIGKLSYLSDLYMGMNKFSGTIPPEIGKLSSLENFLAPSCSITGPLPNELSKLHNLTKLDLSNNPLKCSIPKSIGNLQKLSVLNLVYAELNGTIPPELGNCKNLKTLMLSFNSLSGSLPHQLSEIPLLTFTSEKNLFSGPLPSWIGKWKELDSLLLASNRFSGEIPQGLGDCRKLKHLSLSNNLLTGPIPRELCDSGSLLDIDLAGNFLSGTIDGVFVGCKNLTQLILVNNQINGSIPEYLSQLPLMAVDLDKNNFTGEIPVNLWKSVNLMEFSASYNHLEGHLPAEIGNAVSLERLDLSNNRLKGEIPREIGKLTSLSFVNLNSNLFKGKIPVEVGNCTALTTLDLGNNNLNGSIPDEITGLAQLQCLVLSHNSLSGQIPSKPSAYFHQTEMPDLIFVQHHGVFDLSYNMLTGPIPQELGNCVVVVDILLSNNQLSGEIPASLSRLMNLTTLDLSGNALSGSIPEAIGNSRKLQGLNLGNNQLAGSIPQSFGLLDSLVKLNLTGNKLNGSVPASIGKLKELTHLDLSHNELTGELPLALSEMLNLLGIYIQQNSFSGRIDDLFSGSFAWKVESMNFSNNLFGGSLPASLGNLSYLIFLDLHGNKFTGEVSSGFGNLMQLEYLDVSLNRLSGQIPEKVCALPNLHFLSFADNMFKGDVPSSGICKNLSKASFSGNKGLCGRITGLNCKIRGHLDQTNLLNAWGLGGIVIGSIFLVFATIFSLRRWVVMRNVRQRDTERTEECRLKGFIEPNLYFLSGSRSKEPLSINVATFEQPLLKLSLADILQATDNFCKKNIIGDGGFGTVYKASLPSGKTVAVKKLSQVKTQGNREFIAEMETLGKVKHPNLVSLMGYCSFREEKLLVYEYMKNGSLDHWLRNQTGILEVLDWPKRLQIATGAARGLAFLHHGSIPHIIHRDIKASNILLDNEFKPKVADFGLARLISACETHVSTDIAGTFGYIPPEYGQSGRATTKGDVYSFGVILVELVTGKEPTGPDFKESEGGNLVGWVFQKINKGNAAEVLDPMVLTRVSKPSMLRVLQIAVLCLAETPSNRPAMADVLKALKETVKGGGFA